MPGDSGATVTTRVLSTLNLCTRGCGCTVRPAFPTPFFLGRMIDAQLGRIASRDCGRLFGRPCEERKRRGNPAFLGPASWIASRSLSSGAHSRDPLARNDGCYLSLLFDNDCKRTRGRPRAPPPPTPS